MRRRSSEEDSGSWWEGEGVKDAIARDWRWTGRRVALRVLVDCVRRVIGARSVRDMRAALFKSGIVRCVVICEVVFCLGCRLWFDHEKADPSIDMRIHA